MQTIPPHPFTTKAAAGISVNTKRKVKANVKNINTTAGLSALLSATNAVKAHRLVPIPVASHLLSAGSYVAMNQQSVATAALPVTNGTFNQHPTAPVPLATKVRTCLQLQTPSVTTSTHADLNATFSS